MRRVDGVRSAATTFPVIASRHEDGMANEFPSAEHVFFVFCFFFPERRASAESYSH